MTTQNTQLAKNTITNLLLNGAALTFLALTFNKFEYSVILLATFGFLVAMFNLKARLSGFDVITIMGWFGLLLTFNSNIELAQMSVAVMALSQFLAILRTIKDL